MQMEPLKHEQIPSLAYKSSKLFTRYQYLIGEKSAKKALMRKVDEFFTPDDKILGGQTTVGITSSGLLKGELLDTTGTDLIDEFVNFVLGLQFVTDNRWFSIKDPNSDPTSDINNILNAQADHLYRLISTTNYASSLPHIERDSIVHGHSLLEIEPDEASFAKCYSADPRELVFLQDVFGKVSFAAWPTVYAGFELLDRFPSLSYDRKTKNILDATPSKKFILLTAFYEVPAEHYPLLEQHKKIKYVKSYCAYPGEHANNQDNNPTVLDITEHEMFEEKRVFETRDSLVRNTPYGAGIGRKALPKARTTNKLMYNLLKLTGLQSNPPRVQDPKITAEANNKGELTEGQVITGNRLTMDGEEVRNSVALLQVTGDLNNLIVLYQLQQAMLADLLPTASSIYKKARQSITEIQGRLEEQEKRLAPLRTNFLREGPSQHLKYFYNLAKKQGKFNREDLKFPKGSEPKQIDFIVDAFLLSAFRQGKALRAAQALGIVANFLSLSPSGIDKINVDKVIEVGFDGFNVLDLLDSRAATAEKRQLQQQRLQQEQLQQETQAAAATDASNAKILDVVTQLGQNVA